MCLDGQDPVEMVMEVEEKFDLTIPDEAAGRITTMGQLYDYVLARVARGQAQVCVTSAAFYRLRRALGEVCGVPREQVRTRARLDDLIPLADRPRLWRELRVRLSNLHLPPLRRPAWMVKRIELVTIVILFALMFTLGLCGLVPGLLLMARVHSPNVLLSFLVISLAGAFVGAFLVHRALYRRTERYAVQVPPACATIRDMVYTLVSLHPAAPMVSDTARASDKEIWGTLCAIVGDHFDRPPDSFTRESTIG